MSVEATDQVNIYLFSLDLSINSRIARKPDPWRYISNVILSIRFWQGLFCLFAILQILGFFWGLSLIFFGRRFSWNIFQIVELSIFSSDKRNTFFICPILRKSLLVFSWIRCMVKWHNLRQILVSHQQERTLYGLMRL